MTNTIPFENDCRFDVADIDPQAEVAALRCELAARTDHWESIEWGFRTEITKLRDEIERLQAALASKDAAPATPGPNLLAVAVPDHRFGNPQ